MYERILVTTDGSALSDKAVQSALSLAKLSGATLIVLRVIPRYPRSYLEGGATVDISEIKRIEAQWTTQAQAQLSAIKAEGKGMGVTVKTTIAKSDLVAESIIATADKQEVDLIVMASHGRKGIKRLLLGSETQHVLTHSARPILVLR
ncbi:TRAP-T-associated universal stress protein TeaD [uncultured Comamonas sp.]|nr:TRAP-T-associated universal stress protein TeaD [uncultured Comamonas sp.]